MIQSIFLLSTTPPTGASSGGIPAGLDGTVLHDINAFARATPWLHGPMYGYATYGVALFAMLLVAGWWFARRGDDPARVAAALWAGLGTILAVGINQPIVDAIHEARPYTAVPGLLVLADRSTDFSFPSDHATMAGAAAAGLFLLRRRALAWIAAAAALLIAFARVYIAAHYPQDVLAGLLLGALVTLLGWLLLRRPATALVRLAQNTPLRPLVIGTRRASLPENSTTTPAVFDQITTRVPTSATADSATTEPNPPNPPRRVLAE